MIDTVPITAEPLASSSQSTKAFEVYDLSFDEVCEITFVVNAAAILTEASTQTLFFTFKAFDQKHVPNSMIWEPTEANMLWESIPLRCIAYHSTLTEQALQYIARLSIHFLQIVTLKIFLSVHN